MPHTPQTYLKIAQRRARVAELYFARWPQWRIAAEVGVNPGTISRDLQALLQEWQASGLHDFDAAKAEELARINDLERLYREAWEESKRPKESKFQETTTNKAKLKLYAKKQAKDAEALDKLKASVKTEARDGNPAFLAGIQWCIDKRIEIWGFAAAKKNRLEHTGKDGATLEPVVFHIPPNGREAPGTVPEGPDQGEAGA